MKTGAAHSSARLKEQDRYSVVWIFMAGLESAAASVQDCSTMLLLIRKAAKTSSSRRREAGNRLGEHVPGAGRVRKRYAERRGCDFIQQPQRRRKQRSAPWECDESKRCQAAEALDAYSVGGVHLPGSGADWLSWEARCSPLVPARAFEDL